MENTKLTMVTFTCRYKQITAFVQAKVINGKTIVSNKLVNDLFWKYFGFVPTTGETISIG